MQLSPEVTKFRSTLKEALYVEAASAPTANDDRNQRFIIGSRWVNTLTAEEYVCLDNAPTAAVWKGTTSGGGGGGATIYTSVDIPTVNDDISTGYLIGDIWVRTTNDKVYLCADNTDGAAVWVEVNATVGNIPHSDTIDPTVNDDSVDGYQVGQIWVNTTTDTVFIATDVTVGAAVWANVSGGGGGGAAVDITADADPLLVGTNVQTQLTSISEILRNAVMYTFMAGASGTFLAIDNTVITGYNLTAL